MFLDGFIVQIPGTKRNYSAYVLELCSCTRMCGTLDKETTYGRQKVSGGVDLPGKRKGFPVLPSSLLVTLVTSIFLLL